MSFLSRKTERTKHYFDSVYKHKLQICTACSGSGRYDNDGSPNCGCCDGTGKTLYKVRGTILEYARVVIEVMISGDAIVAKNRLSLHLHRIKNSRYPIVEIEHILNDADIESYIIRKW